MIHDDKYLMLSSRRIPSSSLHLTFASEQIQMLRNQTLQQPGQRLVQSPRKGPEMLLGSRRREDAEPYFSMLQVHNKKYIAARILPIGLGIYKLIISNYALGI